MHLDLRMFRYLYWKTLRKIFIFWNACNIYCHNFTNLRLFCSDLRLLRLISRLSDVGISGAALSWFSYFSDRQFYISVKDLRFPTAYLKQGVPQRSVLGPLQFIIYILPLHQILYQHGFNYHLYADDIENRPTLSTQVHKITACVHTIKEWPTSNFF